MKKLPWSALAMCFDCEGTISLGRHNKTEEGEALSLQLDLTVVNTDERLMRWLLHWFGGRYYHRPMRNPNHKSAFFWRVTGKANKEKILLGVLPYLIMKTEQAKIALEFLRAVRTYPGHYQQRLELYKSCLKLNAKGPAQTTNTLDNPENGLKIESKHDGDIVSAPAVTQGGDKIPGELIAA